MNGIRKLVAAEKWTHYREDNPVDIPSRGVIPIELAGSTLWCHGPSWLINVITRDNDDDISIPEECKKEMSDELRSSTQHSLLTINELKGISHIINCKCFSILRKLLRVTAYVLRFCEIVKNRVKGINRQRMVELTASEIAAVETLWVKEYQVPLRENKLFKV